MPSSIMIVSPLVSLNLPGFTAGAYAALQQQKYPFAKPTVAPNGYVVASSVSQPTVTVVASSKSGQVTRSYSDDFYYRIHVYPAKVDLGNMVSDQNIAVGVWNAFFETKSLQSIDVSGGDGMSLSYAGSLPLVFNRLQSIDFDLNVSIDGPPNVQGSYRFVFGGYTAYLTVVGNRVVIWPFVPQRKIVESHEWKTNVIRTKAGEQRIQLRKSPRVTMSYEFFMNDTQVNRARALTYGWGHRVFGVPRWADVSFFGQLQAGTLVIPVDTDVNDFRAGDPIIVWESDSYFESAVIDTVGSGIVNLKLPLQKSFSSAYVAPVRFARSKGLNLTRAANKLVIAAVDFDVTKNADIAESIGFATYKGLDIVTDTMHVVGSIEEKVIRDMHVIDNDIGTVYYDPLYNNAAQTFFVSWSLTNRADLRRVLNWIYTRKGKLKPFWLPTNTSDMVLAADASMASSTIYVESFDYGVYYTSRALRIEKKDGATKYVYVTGGQYDGGYDALPLDEPLGINLNVADVKRISIMYKVRFDSDRVEVNSDDYGVFTVKVPVVEVSE